jgi:transcriptional regulator with XRE-family HTH domain
MRSRGAVDLLQFLFIVLQEAEREFLLETAKAAGLSVSAVVKLERGGMDPSWSTVQRLAKALGVGTEAMRP